MPTPEELAAQDAAAFLKRPVVKVKTLGPTLANPDVADAFQRLRALSRQRGLDVQLSSGDRSDDQQRAMYYAPGTYQISPHTRMQPNGLPVAEPGRSKHNQGEAADIKVFDAQGRRLPPSTVYPEAEIAGWKPLKGDPPHLNYAGLTPEQMAAQDAGKHVQTPEEMAAEDARLLAPSLTPAAANRGIPMLPPVGPKPGKPAAYVEGGGSRGSDPPAKPSPAHPLSLTPAMADRGFPVVEGGGSRGSEAPPSIVEGGGSRGSEPLHPQARPIPIPPQRVYGGPGLHILNPFEVREIQPHSPLERAGREVLRWTVGTVADKTQDARRADQLAGREPLDPVMSRDPKVRVQQQKEVDSVHQLLQGYLTRKQRTPEELGDNADRYYAATVQPSAFFRDLRDRGVKLNPWQKQVAFSLLSAQRYRYQGAHRELQDALVHGGITAVAAAGGGLLAKGGEAVLGHFAPEVAEGVGNLVAKAGRAAPVIRGGGAGLYHGGIFGGLQGPALLKYENPKATVGDLLEASGQSALEAGALGGLLGAGGALGGMALGSLKQGVRQRVVSLLQQREALIAARGQEASANAEVTRLEQQLAKELQKERAATRNAGKPQGLGQRNQAQAGDFLTRPAPVAPPTDLGRRPAEVEVPANRLPVDRHPTNGQFVPAGKGQPAARIPTVEAPEGPLKVVPGARFTSPKNSLSAVFTVEKVLPNQQVVLRAENGLKLTTKPEFLAPPPPVAEPTSVAPAAPPVAGVPKTAAEPPAGTPPPGQPIDTDVFHSTPRKIEGGLKPSAGRLFWEPTGVFTHPSDVESLHGSGRLSVGASARPYRFQAKNALVLDTPEKQSWYERLYRSELKKAVSEWNRALGSNHKPNEDFLYLSTEGLRKDAPAELVQDRVTRRLREMGYDALIFGDDGDHIALDPSILKPREPAPPKSPPAPPSAPIEAPAPHPAGAFHLSTDPAELSQRTWYHGSGAAGLKAGDISTGTDPDKLLFGQGFYLTDEPSIAEGYAKTRGRTTKTPTVYQVGVNVRNPLNLEEPAPAPVRQVFEQKRNALAQEAHTDSLDAALRDPQATPETMLRALYSDLRDYSHEDRIPAHELHHYVPTEELKGLGYDALTHTGGKRTGKPPHQVLIVLDPKGTVERVAARGGEAAPATAKPQSRTTRDAAQKAARAKAAEKALKQGRLSVQRMPQRYRDEFPALAKKFEKLGASDEEATLAAQRELPRAKKNLEYLEGVAAPLAQKKGLTYGEAQDLSLLDEARAEVELLEAQARTPPTTLPEAAPTSATDPLTAARQRVADLEARVRDPKLPKLQLSAVSDELAAARRKLRDLENAEPYTPTAEEAARIKRQDRQREAYRKKQEATKPVETAPARRVVGNTELDEAESKVYAELSGNPRSIDDLIDATGLSPSDTSRSLMTLELKKIARRLPGNHYQLIEAKPEPPVVSQAEASIEPKPGRRDKPTPPPSPALQAMLDRAKPQRNAVTPEGFVRGEAFGRKPQPGDAALVRPYAPDAGFEKQLRYLDKPQEPTAREPVSRPAKPPAKPASTAPREAKPQSASKGQPKPLLAVKPGGTALPADLKTAPTSRLQDATVRLRGKTASLDAEIRNLEESESPKLPPGVEYEDHLAALEKQRSQTREQLGKAEAELLLRRIRAVKPASPPEPPAPPSKPVAASPAPEQPPLRGVKFEDRLTPEQLALAREAERVQARTYVDAVKGLARGSEEMIRKEVAAKKAKLAARGGPAPDEEDADFASSPYFAEKQAERAARKSNQPITELAQGGSHAARPRPSANPRIPVDPLPGGQRKPLPEIKFDLEKSLGHRVQVGKTGKRGAIGIYSPSSARVTVRSAADLDTIAHEIGHRQDDTLNLVGRWAGKRQRSPFDSELIPHFSAHGSRGKTLAYTRAEGVAEWVRAWVLNPKAAEAAAPTFSAYFKRTAPRELQQALRAFGDDIRRHAGLPAEERLLANVRTELPAKPPLAQQAREAVRGSGRGYETTKADHLYAALVDDIWPAIKGARAAAELRGVTPLPKQDFELLARVHGGLTGKVLNWMERGPLTGTGTRRAGFHGGFAEHVLGAFDQTSKATLKRDMEQTAAYMIAQRTKALVEAGRAPDLAVGTESQYAQALETLKDHAAKPQAQRARIEEGAERYRQWADANLEYLKEKGRISAQQLADIRQENPFYVDMHRVMEDAGIPQPRPRGSGRALGPAAKVIQRFKGSARQLEDPYVNLREATAAIIKEADRNAVMQPLRDLLTQDRAMYQGQPLDLSAIGSLAKKGDTDTVSIFVDGKEEKWKFEAGIHTALKQLGATGELPPWLEPAAALVNVLKAGVTHSPGFAGRNFLRDLQDRLITSPTLTRLGLRKGTAEGLRALGPAARGVGKSEMEAFGGSQAGHYARSKVDWHKAQEREIKRLTRDPKSVVARLSAAGEWVIGRGEASERVNRLAEANPAYEHARNTLHYNEENARLYAAAKARELMDFQVAGRYTRYANRVVPFLNPQVQGLVRTIRLARQNPAGFISRWAAVAVAPTLALWAIHQKDGTLEEYRQLPAYQRDLFYNIKAPWGGWIRIPKPFEPGVLASGVERILDRMFGNRHAFEGYGGTLAEQLLPIKSESLSGPLLPIMEAQSNYDYFRQRHIIPPDQEKRALELRPGTERASVVGRAGQAVLKVDARKVDHVVRGMTGGLGDLILKASDVAAGPDRQEALKRMGGSVVGLTAPSPLYDARDVQYDLDRAAELGRENDPEIKSLLQLLRLAAQAKGAERARQEQTVRTLATQLRPLLEQQPAKPRR